jgi:hypothetical protein
LGNNWYITKGKKENFATDQVTSFIVFRKYYLRGTARVYLLVYSRSRARRSKHRMPNPKMDQIYIEGVPCEIPIVTYNGLLEPLELIAAQCEKCRFFFICNDVNLNEIVLRGVHALNNWLRFLPVCYRIRGFLLTTGKWLQMSTKPKPSVLINPSLVVAPLSRVKETEVDFKIRFHLSDMFTTIK